MLKMIRSYVNALVSLNLCIIEFIKDVEVSDKMRGLSSVLSIILNAYKKSTIHEHEGKIRFIIQKLNYFEIIFDFWSRKDFVIMQATLLWTLMHNITYTK